MITQEDTRKLWKQFGGYFFGPNVEQACIEEQAFFRFCEAHRIAAEEAALDRLGLDEVTCDYCSAQVILAGRHFIQRISDTLDDVGAPKSSSDGTHSYSIFQRITELANRCGIKP